VGHSTAPLFFSRWTRRICCGIFLGDQWVTVEVEVCGNETIIHRIDDVVILQYEKPQYDPGDGDAKKLIEANDGKLLIEGGTISVQSESHPTDIRKIEIKVLKP
jgi:hypothetical protein